MNFIAFCDIWGNLYGNGTCGRLWNNGWLRYRRDGGMESQYFEESREFLSVKWFQ